MSVTCTGEGKVTFRKLSGNVPLDIGKSSVKEIIHGHRMDRVHYQVGSENTIVINSSDASLVCDAQ